MKYKFALKGLTSRFSCISLEELKLKIGVFLLCIPQLKTETTEVS